MLKKKYSIPKISVCISVYNTELFLERCLKSVFEQDFESFEIVLVNDCSRGKNERGDNCKKIFKRAKKYYNSYRKKGGLAEVTCTYIEHNKNMGTLETRRTAFEAAIGDYIIQLDSDDAFCKDALKILYNSSDNEKFDIVQGRAKSLVYLDKNYEECPKNLQRNIFYYEGEIFNHEIFHKSFYNHFITCTLWNKLIKRELYEKAFNDIPHSYCVMNEDFLIYFFISLYAKSFNGIDSIIHFYTVDTGITADKCIKDLRFWENKCTTSNVVTVIEYFLINNKGLFSKKELKLLKNIGVSFAETLIRDFNYLVHPEIKAKAYELLCFYFGDKNIKLLMQQCMGKKRT